MIRAINANMSHEQGPARLRLGTICCLTRCDTDRMLRAILPPSGRIFISQSIHRHEHVCICVCVCMSGLVGVCAVMFVH